VGAATVAGNAQNLNEMQESLRQALVGADIPAAVADALARVTFQAGVLGVGNAAGGAGAGAAAMNVDANNRQLHPTEILWIKSNAKTYAALKGISVAAAEKQLAEQAYRQVQFGAEGGAAAWDAEAAKFLRHAGTQALPEGGYLFYATPDQKANAMMYLDSAIQNNDFYAKNGLQLPTVTDIQSAATRDAQIRANLGTITKAAAAASATVALAGLAPSMLNWALSNPEAATSAGIITAETAAAISSGAVTPSTLLPVLNSAGVNTAAKLGGVAGEATVVKGVAGASGVVGSVNVGPWSKGITNVVDSGTFTQCGNGSCVSATAQVLTNGAVTEAQVVARIGEWADPLKLPGVLNDLAPGSIPWRGGYFGSGADAVTIANKGPMGAVLQAPGNAAHMVTISPIPGASGMFRVQDTGVGKTYDVPASWISQYVVGGVWK
jgi:hypothetical protein